MTAKRSRASKARWAKIPPEERSKIMSIKAKRKHRLISREDRKKFSKVMLKARLLKRGY